MSNGKSSSNDVSNTMEEVYANLEMEEEEEPMEDTTIELKYHSNHNDYGGSNANCSGHQKIIMLDLSIRRSCSKSTKRISGTKCVKQGTPRQGGRTGFQRRTRISPPQEKVTHNCI